MPPTPQTSSTLTASCDRQMARMTAGGGSKQTTNKGPKREIARMTSGGGRFRQRNLNWRFDEEQGIILHQLEDEDDEDDEDVCDACSWFDAHYIPRNGKEGSFDEATLARDRWFRQNLVPFSDSVELQDLVAKTLELERVRGELTGKCCEAERLCTELKVAEDALENEKQQRGFIWSELSQLKRQCRADDKERNRLVTTLKDKEAQRKESARKLSELQEERTRRRFYFAEARRKLGTAQHELDTTRRELDTTRRELENAQREIVQMRLSPLGPVASTSSVVPSGHEACVVLSP